MIHHTTIKQVLQFKNNMVAVNLFIRTFVVLVIDVNHQYHHFLTTVIIIIIIIIKKGQGDRVGKSLRLFPKNPFQVLVLFTC